MEPQVHRPDRSGELLTPERCFILEASNSPADEGLSVARARVPVGVTTVLHSVDGADERYLIVEGRGHVVVGAPGGGAIESDVSEGDVVVIPSGAPQRIANTGETDLVFYALCTPRFRPEMYRVVE